jgi:uncharacterized SAM-binding protein YcdF (DUF218 family)
MFNCKEIMKPLIMFSVIISVIICLLFESKIHFEFPEKIRSVLKANLTSSVELPNYEADILYILGGSVKSMSYHIKTASVLYKTGNTKKIVYFNTKNNKRNKKTEKMLQNAGVLKSDIEPLTVKNGVFGTMSEARAIADYMRRNSYKSVILVSSPCHTRRVKFSFNKFLKPVGINIYIKGSEDKFAAREMILELIKLKIYQLILNTFESNLFW